MLFNNVWIVLIFNLFVYQVMCVDILTIIFIIIFEEFDEPWDSTIIKNKSIQSTYIVLQ